MATTLKKEIIDCAYVSFAIGLSASPLFGLKNSGTISITSMLKCSMNAIFWNLMPDSGYEKEKFAVALADKTAALFLINTVLKTQTSPKDVLTSVVNEAFYRSFDYYELRTNETLSVNDRVFIAEMYTSLLTASMQLLTLDAKGALITLAKDFALATVTSPAAICLVEDHIRPLIDNSFAGNITETIPI